MLSFKLALILVIVLELTDDKTLEKPIRKQDQITHAPHASKETELVKLADKIASSGTFSSKPSGWEEERKQEYFNWASKVVTGLRGTHAGLKTAFDKLPLLESLRN